VIHGRRAGVLAALLLLAAGADAEPSAADDRAPTGPHLAVAAGLAELFDPDLCGLASIAWQDRHGARRASPWLFAETTERDHFFGFGALVDFPVGSRTLVTPSLAIALYHEHDGLGLGSMFEVRSALEATWPLRTGRIGAAVLHYSNARIGGDHNPGTEALLLVWMTPIGAR
jgi:hypothetical protein